MNEAIEPGDDAKRPPSPARAALRRALYYATIALRVAVVVAVVALNLRLYDDLPATYAPGRVGADARAQLAFLRRALDEGAASRMQARYPEGYFFSWVLFGLASADVASLLPPGDPERAARLEDARHALAALASDEGRAAFSAGAPPGDAFGVFYWGWRTFLEGRVLGLVGPDGDAALREQLVADAARVASHFPRGETPFPESYEGQAWPCDAVVAQAALALHDAILPPRYERLRATWIERSGALLDPGTGLYPHRVYPDTGALADGSRATSQVIIQRFLPWVSPELARSQYPTFRALFATTRFGLPAVQEYPPGVPGTSDVDSGPLFFGISASSSVLAIGPALLHGDRALAEPLVSLGEVLGVPYVRGGEKAYALGLLPVSDAFLLYSKLAYAAAPPGFEPAAPSPAVVGPSWRSGVHVASAVFLVPLLAVPVVRLWRRRKRARDGA